MRDPRPLAFPALAVGVLAVSSAAVLIREAAAPALVIAAYRLGLAAIPTGFLTLVVGREAVNEDGNWRWSVLAGTFLALHFGFWIASLQQTSVISSVVLVTTNPLFVAIASSLLLGERVRGATWAGIAVATAGAAAMAGGDIRSGLTAVRGDIFALLGAVFSAGYLMVGRKARPASSWLGYIGVVYSVAAVLLVLAALVARDGFTGYSAKTYVMLALLAVVPQLIGHSAINWSLAYIPAAIVAVAILGEPVGATALAAATLGEVPGVLEVGGAFLVMAGVYVALRPGIAAGAPPAADAVRAGTPPAP